MVNTRKCTRCKQRKKITAFNKKSSRKDGISGWCRTCENVSSRRYYAANKGAVLAQHRLNVREKKKWFTKLKESLLCVVCGESDPACLDFHHINPDKKGGRTHKVAHLASSTCSQERVMEEIKKCIVMCSNCHRKFHAYGWRISRGKVIRSQ